MSQAKNSTGSKKPQLGVASVSATPTVLFVKNQSEIDLIPFSIHPLPLSELSEEDFKNCFMLKNTIGDKDDLMIAQLDADLLASKTRFIVDLGSQICLIDPEKIAKHSKVHSLEKPFLAKGLNGKILIDRKIKLNFFNSFEHDFHILDNCTELLGEPALLGINFLDRIFAKIDLAKNVINCVVNGEESIIKCEKRSRNSISSTTPRVFM